MPDVAITIDEGTLLLVAEILRHQRKEPAWSYDEARTQIFAAVKRLNKGEQE